MGAEIARLEIEVESSASKANQQLDLMIDKLNKVTKSLSGIDISKLRGVSDSVRDTGKSAQDSANKAKNMSSSMATMAMHTDISNSKLKKLTSTFEKYIAKTTIANHKSRSLSQTFGHFYATFFPIIRGVKALGRSIESSMDYIETFNYYNVTMDKIGKEFSDQYKKYGYDSAEAYTTSFTSRLNDLTKKMTGFEVGKDGVLNLTGDMNLGLDPNQIMNYQASISAVTNSVGLCGETSVNTSKALSMLSADLSSFKNVDLSTVMTNMQSGLIGQSRALYKYGIDITNATLQTYAYKYGLSTAVSEMTQADKMQLRLLAILDQSKIAWGDQANTINSVANQYRIMKQQIQNVSRMIGNVLMPVIKAVLPFINGMLIATQRLIKFIGGLLGIDFKKIMDGISSGYSGIDAGEVADDTEDFANNAGNASKNLGKAKKNAKDLKNALLGIDELNVIQPDENSDSGNGVGGGSGVGSGIGGGIDLSDEIGLAVAAYEAVWNDAFKSSVNKAQVYADKICSVFSHMWSLIKSEDYKGLGQYIAGGVDFVFEKINSVFNWQKTGPTITAFVNGYTQTMNSLVSNVDWRNIGKTIGDGFNVITNTMYLYLSGMNWTGLGCSFASGMNGMFNSVDWKMLGQTIGAWLMKIPNIVYGFVNTLDWSQVGYAIGTTLNGALLEFDGKTIAGGINGIVYGFLDALKSFIKTVDWSDVAKAVGDVLGNLAWGKLAGIGLAIGAVKIVSVFGGLLTDGFAKGLSDFIGSVVEKYIASFCGKVTEMFKFVSDDGAIITGFKALGMKISTALGGITFPAVGIVAGIALVAAGIINLWKTSETFRDSVSQMWDRICEAFSYARKRIWDDGLRPLWDNIKEFFGSLYGLYEGSGVKGIFEDIVVAIGSRITGAFSGFVKILGNVIGTIVSVASGIIKVLTGVIEFITGIFSGNWEKSWSGIQKIVSGIVDCIAAIFSGLWETIRIIFSPVVNWFKENFSGAYEAIKSTFKFLDSWFRDKWNAVRRVFGDVKDFFKGGFQKAYDAVKAIWDGIGKYFSEIANNIITPIGKAVNGVIKGINWVLDKVGSKTKLSLWEVPKFASGTNGLPQNTLGMVNDQKGSTYKEMIVPPHGNPFIPQGRNVMLPMQKGTKIMPANQTKAFMESLPHFAKGIGDFFGNAWSKFKDFTGNIFDYITNPEKILQIAIDKFTNLAGVLEPMLSIASGTIGTVFDGVVGYIKKMFDSTGAAGIEKAIAWALGIANDNSHGYDQAHRTGPDYDCSSLVTTALKNAGFKVPIGTTSTMYDSLISAGFKNIVGSVDRSSSSGMRRGDILLTPGKHTAMYIGDGKIVHASINELGRTVGGKSGDQTGKEITTRGYYNFPWTYVLRYAKAYADGGFPNNGEYFLAREKGPELVGRIGNRNAVVNNDQIVASVSRGVESAIQRQNSETNYLLRKVVELEQALLEKENSVKLDGKKVDKQLSKARRNTGFNFSPA